MLKTRLKCLKRLKYIKEKMETPNIKHPTYVKAFSPRP